MTCHHLGKDTSKTVEPSKGLSKPEFRIQELGFRSFNSQSLRNQESFRWEHIKRQNIVFSMNYDPNVQVWPSLLF